MEAVANNVLPGIKYKGIVYEGDAQHFSPDLPNAGIDVQNEIVNWLLPDGRCMAWTVAELAQKRPDELIDPSAREAYFAVGKDLGYLPLGMLPDEEFEIYREAPGALEERLWRRYKWAWPENETESQGTRKT